jgi:tetratricopeptide (TPR) repeat protein
MGQKFFISFNSADQAKAHWIAWVLKEAGHEVAVHDWEVPAGGNAPLWMNNRLAWADRLIAVISPDYLPARYSPMEWASQIWNDPDGTKGSVIPVIVRPTPRMPPLLNPLSRIDLTNCSESEANRRLIQGVDMPAPPQRKPAFEKVKGEAPDSQHTGPAEKPTFIQVNVCGDLVIGITLEQYEAGLNKRAEEIRAEEVEKRVQLQKLVELTERATSAEKDNLRIQIAAVEAEKRALEAERKGVADRLTNLQASYDGLVQKLAEANAALEAFAPLISQDAFEQARAMLRRGDVLGGEGKFVEIADTVRKIREQADMVEARAIFQAGQLADQRIDWRMAYTYYARAASLRPSDLRYVESAGKLAREIGDYAAAVSFTEAALNIATSKFGADSPKTAVALNNLAVTYEALARYAEAEPLYRRAIETDEKTFGKDHPGVAVDYNNLALLLQDEGKYAEAEPLYRRAIEIGEKTLGKDHPSVAIRYNNLASLLEDQGKYAEAEPIYRRAIEIDEKFLGTDHPQVAIRFNNLALLLQHQGKYAEAEALYRRAIEIGEETLGTDHPDVASWYNNLAVLRKDQGKYAEAEPLYRRAIEIGEKTLGKDHPEVAKRYNNLAVLRKDQGKYAEAEPLYRRAIEIGEKTLGKDHPEVATGYNNLAVLLQDQGKYAEAEPLYRRAIEIGERTLGKEHPDAATWHNNLATLLADQSKYVEAEPLLRRALEIFQVSFGPEHPKTLAAKSNYDTLRRLNEQNSENSAR